jgi:hypothetical protein
MSSDFPDELVYQSNPRNMYLEQDVNHEDGIDSVKAGTLIRVS